MIFETIMVEGLSHFSYVIGDEAAGICAVIDPRRDVDIYLDIAHKNKVEIAYILETHVHADFVSGSCELAARTGAPICVGARDEYCARNKDRYGFEHRPLQEGDVLEIGPIRLTVLHTPGHTPEHVCYMMSGGRGAEEPWGLFSGDALLAGEVGLPDLIDREEAEELVPQLYDTLFNKLLTLGDDIVIYPAHGTGSPYARTIGDRHISTTGYERQHNPRLQIKDKDEFIKTVLESLTPAPSYYRRMREMNTQGPPIVGVIPHVPSVGPDQFEAEMQEPNTIVVDTREIESFGGAHIGEVLNIILRETFPVWAGWLLPPDQRILLVLSSENDLERVQRHLLRVGHTDLVGYLRRGTRGWIEAGKPFRRIKQVSVHELNHYLENAQGDWQLLDVRTEEEWNGGHIPTARHKYLPCLSENLEILDPAKPVVLYCATGYRSNIGASILERNGFRKIYNIPGSMSAWKSAGFSLSHD